MFLAALPDQTASDQRPCLQIKRSSGLFHPQPDQPVAQLVLAPDARWVSEFGNYPTSWLTDPRFLLGVVVFVGGYALNLSADRTLRELRRPGESGYRIPQGTGSPWEPLGHSRTVPATGSRSTGCRCGAGCGRPGAPCPGCCVTSTAPGSG